METEVTNSATTSTLEPTPNECQCRRLLRWRPTSKEKLDEVENKILREYLTVPFKTRMVQLSKPKHGLWTISVNEDHSGTPIVLVHGMGGGIGLWAKNISELSKNRPLYAFDLLGFGKSSRPTLSSKPDVAEEQIVDSIEEWRKEMNLEKFILLGHSLGGYISTAYALKYPNRIQHLIPADPWGYHEKPEETAIPTRYKVLLGIGSLFYPMSVIRASGPFGPGLVKKFRSDIQDKFSDVLTDNTITNYIYHCNARKPSGEVAFKSLSLGPFIWAKNPMINRLEMLPKEIPISILYGSDSWMDKTAGYLIQSSRDPSYVSVQKIPDAGHHVYADRSDIFNAVVTEICKAADHNSVVGHDTLANLIESF